MRIAICGTTYYPGNNGQAIFTIHLAEELARAGNEVAVIIPADEFNWKLQQKDLNGAHLYKVRSIPVHWLHPGASFTPIPDDQLQTVFRTFRPDVIHIQDHYFLCRAAAVVARRMGIPIMGTNHFLPENVLPYLTVLPLPRKTKIAVMWGLMLWTYNLLDLVTTPTETAASILCQQKIRPPVLPVSCGVDTHRFYPDAHANRRDLRGSFGLDPDLPLLLYVGRLDREKRIDLIIRGLARLRETTDSKIQVAIAGQGAFGKELIALSNQLGLTDSIRFLGYVPSERLLDLYHSADVFVMPSPEELQSIATLEAMASGLPILAANARALPELVSSDVNGALFEPGNLESIVQEISRLLAQAQRWPAMGIASRSRAVAHSLENTVRRYEELYGRLSQADAPQMSETSVVKVDPVKS